MTRWWWVRHGPTHRKDMIGWTDVPADLSNTKHLAWLRNTLPCSAPIMSSDLIRAVDTATAVQDDRSRLPHATALREIHFGDWEGQHLDDLGPQDRDHIRRYWDQPGDVAAPEGESWHDLCNRVSSFIDTQSFGQDVIVVAHMGTILTQVQRALGLSNYDTLGQRIDNLSITQLISDNGSWRAEFINQIP